MGRPNQFTNPWTEEQDWLVREGYQDKNVTWEDLVEMTGRTKAALQQRAQIVLGVGTHWNNAKKNWTEEEEELVKKYYCDPDKGRHWLAKELGRTAKSISHRAQHLNVKLKPFYSDEEVQYLLDNFDPHRPTESGHRIGKILGRSAQSVLAKASELNLRIQQVEMEPWQVDYIRENYAHQGARKCAEAIGWGSVQYITSKAQDLGVVVDLKTKRKLEWAEKFKDSDYEIIKYEGEGEYADIKHLTCGHIWNARLSGVLSRYAGCPSCSKGNWNRKIFYLIYFEELNLYKVGITMNLNKRMTQYNYKPTVLDVIYFDTAQECMKYENTLKKALKPYLVDTGVLFSGNTETFYWPE